jgi:hypothetical protein
MEPNKKPKTRRDENGIEYDPDPSIKNKPGWRHTERITDVLGRPIVDHYEPDDTGAETTGGGFPRSYYNYRVLGQPTPQPPADNQDARIFTRARYQLPNGYTLTINPDPMMEAFYQNFIAAAWHGQLKGQPNHFDPSSTYLVLTNLFGTTDGAPNPRIMAHSAVYNLQDLLKGETTTDCWCITIHPVGENHLDDYEQGSEEFYQQTLEKHQVNVKRLGLVDTGISLFDDELCELFHPSICDDLAKPVQNWVAKAETKWEYLWHVNTIFVDTPTSKVELAETESLTQKLLLPLSRTTLITEETGKNPNPEIKLPNPKPQSLQGLHLVLFHIQILTWWLNNLENIIRNFLANLRRDVARRHATNVLKNTGYRLVNPMTA